MFLKEHNPNKIWLALLNHAPSIRPRLASAGREAPCGSAIKQSNQTGLTGRISPHTTKPWKKSQYFERSRRPNSQKFYDENFMQTAEKAPRFQAHPPQSLDLVQFWEQWVVQELETYWKLTIQKVVLLDRSWCLPASPHTCSSHGCAGLNQVNHCLRWHNEKCHACPRRCICISTCVCIFKHNDIDITHKVTNLISGGFKKFPLRPSSLHNDLSKQKHWVASPLSIYKHLHKGNGSFSNMQGEAHLPNRDHKQPPLSQRLPGGIFNEVKEAKR